MGYTFDTKYHTPFRLPRVEPERKGRFQVSFGGKFCYQFYFVEKMELPRRDANLALAKKH